LAVIVPLMVLAPALLTFGSGDSGAQTSAPPFEPGGFVCLDDFDSQIECDGDPSPQATSDLRSTFCLGWNDDCTEKDKEVRDAMWDSTILFLPPEFAVASEGSAEIGALVGRMSAEVTMGLVGNACSVSLGVSFTLMNASTDPNDLILPKQVGESDAFQPLAEDGDSNGIPDGAERYPSFLTPLFDPDWAGPGPDGDPGTADDDDGPAESPTPRARYFAATKVPSEWVVLNVVVFEPGVTLRGPDGPRTLDPTLGYPAVIVLQNPTMPPAQSPISDLCAPFRAQYTAFAVSRDNPCTPEAPEGRANCPGQTRILTAGFPLLPCDTGNKADEDGDGSVNDGCAKVNVISEADIAGACANDLSDDGEDANVNDGCPPLGDVSEGGFIPDPDGCDEDENEAGCVLLSNPASDGTYVFEMYAVSQRDADGDGIENSLDTCALRANAEWDARNVDSVHDGDSDGLPDVCDPDPQVPSPGSPQGCPAGLTGPDEDQDCFSNRQDNCPLANQLEDPDKEASDTNRPRPIDSDRDGIGDACDVVNGGDPLFGHSEGGPSQPDGALAALCASLPVAIGVGTDTVPAAPAFDTDAPGCVEGAAAPLPSVTPGASAGRSPGGDDATDAAGFEGGPGSGIGSLAPSAGGIPAWAAILGAMGGSGVLAGGAALWSRVRGRVREQ
jgi:hypothetical protein